MTMLAHVQLMLGYNKRLNRQLYEAAARLTDAQLREDKGAYFRSVLGTLNHLVVADLIWLSRFPPSFPHFQALNKVQEFPRPQALAQVLYTDLAALRPVRETLDAMLIDWGQRELTAVDLEQDLVYVNMKGIRSIRNFGEVLLHVLNHQTHHRGQASTLLNQAGQDVGIMDFLMDIPDRAAVCAS